MECLFLSKMFCFKHIAIKSNCLGVGRLRYQNKHRRESFDRNIRNVSKTIISVYSHVVIKRVLKLSNVSDVNYAKHLKLFCFNFYTFTQLPFSILEFMTNSMIFIISNKTILQHHYMVEIENLEVCT